MAQNSPESTCKTAVMGRDTPGGFPVKLRRARGVWYIAPRRLAPVLVWPVCGSRPSHDEHIPHQLALRLALHRRRRCARRAHPALLQAHQPEPPHAGEAGAVRVRHPAGGQPVGAVRGALLRLRPAVPGLRRRGRVPVPVGARVPRPRARPGSSRCCSSSPCWASACCTPGAREPSSGRERQLRPSRCATPSSSTSRSPTSSPRPPTSSSAGRVRTPSSRSPTVSPAAPSRCSAPASPASTSRATAWRSFGPRRASATS